MPDTWEALEHDCKNCRECSLWETRTNVVFGVGNQNAEVLFIGEGPGANEDAQGVPFVGRAGHLLDDMLEIIGLKRDDVYIANIVKCRPPENRDPLGVEQDACIGYLRRQVALLRPKIIVCLGRIAAMRIIKPDFMAVYHPAALLRDPRRRPESFEDFKGLQQKINELCEHTHAVS